MKKEFKDRLEAYCHTYYRKGSRIMVQWIPEYPKLVGYKDRGGYIRVADSVGQITNLYL